MRAIRAPPTGGGSGHPCDSPNDILYPYASGGPLSSLVLDAGHDDYYAHPDSDPWIDIQDSRWLHRLDLGQVPLAVSLSGGPGTITSDVPGVDCAATCTTQWDQGAELRLTAVPAASDRFIRWSGSCTGNTDCVLKLAQAATATAVFGPLRIPVRLSVAGKGRIACVPACGRTVPGGEPLSLRALPVNGVEVRGLERRLQGNAPALPPGNDLFGRRPRGLHEEALSQSRSSAGAGAGVPASSARSSPTVLDRSASTSCRWIVSRFTWREKRKSASSRSG